MLFLSGEGIGFIGFDQSNDIQPTVPIRPMCFGIHRKAAGDDTIFIFGERGGNAIQFRIEITQNICEFLKTKFSSTLKDIPTSYINYDILPSLPTGPMSSNIFKKHVAFLNS